MPFFYYAPHASDGDLGWDADSSQYARTYTASTFYTATLLQFMENKESM